jgi:glycosyltransferase involved in cell wall biosynthesis
VRVLLVAPFESEHTKRWLQRLVQRGLEVAILDMNGPSSTEIKEPFVYFSQRDLFPGVWQWMVWLRKMGSWTLPLRGLAYFMSLIPLCKWLRKNKFNVVNVHWLLHPLSVLFSLQRVCPVVATPWGSDVLLPHLQARKFRIQFQRVFYEFSLTIVTKRVDHFICDASHIRQKLLTMLVPQDRIDLVYFGTDVEKYCASNRNEQFRRSHGAEPGDVVILSNRILNEDVYQISLLLRAIPIILSSNSLTKIHIWIVGGGKDALWLQELSEKLDLTSTVHFLGRLPDDEFATATASCDIYISTSPTDGGLAASVAEAMASERPVIVSDFGDNPFWLESETAGLLFSSGSHFSLAEKAVNLIRDPSAALIMGKRGRDIIVEKNNADIEAQKVIAVYKKVSSLRVN